MQLHFLPLNQQCHITKECTEIIDSSQRKSHTHSFVIDQLMTEGCDATAFNPFSTEYCLVIRNMLLPELLSEILFYFVFCLHHCLLVFVIHQELGKVI